MNKRRAKAGERRPRPESHPALYRAQTRPAIDLADVKGYLAFRHKLREQSGLGTFAEAKDVVVREQREKENERRIAANREKAEVRSRKKRLQEERAALVEAAQDGVSTAHSVQLHDALDAWDAKYGAELKTLEADARPR